MAKSARTVEYTTEIVEVEPARPAVYRTESREVATVTLALSQEEADSLATLLYCHIGGLHRSPALSAVLEALQGAEANQDAHHLLGRELGRRNGGGDWFGCTVLTDPFDLDVK